MAQTVIEQIPAFGDHSKSVAALQRKLIELGYDSKGVDGLFGSNTRAAIKSFQQAKGLAETGAIGPKTLAVLDMKVSEETPIGTRLVTKDVAGKRSRHLHPAMRLRLEAIVFEKGIVPPFWQNKELPKVCQAVQHALGTLGIKEEGSDNHGLGVGQVQSTIGGSQIGGDGDAWCLEFSQMKIALIEDFYQKESPVPALNSCVDCWNGAKKIAGLTTQTPTEGTLALAKHTNSPGRGHAMECYQLLGRNKMKTVEGNMDIPFSKWDVSTFNERNVARNNVGELVTLGFVFVYPDNIIPV